MERWAATTCKRDNTKPSAANRRLILGDVLFLIRFPLFSSAQLAAGPIKNGLLNETELLSELMFHNGGAPSQLVFSTERRHDAVRRSGLQIGEEVFVQSPAGYWFHPAKITGNRASHLVFTWSYSGAEGTAAPSKILRAAEILKNGQPVHALVEKGYYRYAVYVMVMLDGRHCVHCNKSDVIVRFEELMIQTAASHVLKRRQVTAAAANE
ncbi:uncharacterized protein LOC129602312 [Paramacrobiotus metropolitanus]|uniref:uncharacterized protein LOC129602312 n=1 Tax=Paramacrobiotus metropolitanus TaxID=2943436 RepID=UPI0024465C12|nr:uncharacterized protein LOC129602312 [Paramacrobiotus metropolitanus]